jgi:hypothetical protein
MPRSAWPTPYRRPAADRANVLDVLAHVAGLGQGRCIGDAEGHIQTPRQRLGQEGFSRAGRTDQQDVAFFDLDIRKRVIARDRGLGEPLVVVVHRHRQHLLGVIVPDDY